MWNLQGRSLIAGQPAEASRQGETFSGVNPATGEPISPPFHSTTPDQLDQAVRAADDAFGSYRNTTGEQRAKFLRAIAKNLEDLTDTLIARAGQETGLPEARLRGETGRTTNQLRLFASLVEEGSWVDARIDPAIADRQPLPRPDLRSMLRPLGPVAVFGASNFPLAFSVAGGDTASALAAGCPVVVKAHPAHPGTSELVGRAISAAAAAEGLPGGVFSLLFDAGHAVGSALVQHPLIKGVGFTGSLRAGRALFDLAAARPEPIPVYAEMGSVTPILLLPGALETRGEQIAAGLHQSITMGVGQFCTKPGLVFTSGHAGFRERLKQLMQETPPGCMLHPGIAASYQQGVGHLRAQGGVQAAVPPTDHAGESFASACLLELEAELLLTNPALAEEVFGPVALLVRYRHADELVAVARALTGQLTASVHATEQDRQAVERLLPVLETRAGRLIFDQFPTGVEVGHAMVHGGPYPATTEGRSTSVGTRAILRFARPVCYQNVPEAFLPPALQSSNPLALRRLRDGRPE